MGDGATKTEGARPATSAILGLRDGGNLLLSEKLPQAKESDAPSGGVIYTDEMPKLKDLLERYDVVTAVLSEPSSAAAAPLLGAAREARSATGSTGFSRAVILGGFPAATLIAGIVMMVGALAGGRAVSNPYIALFLILAGLGLGLTSWLALRQARTP
jgi:hypothetical protein